MNDLRTVKFKRRPNGIRVKGGIVPNQVIYKQRFLPGDVISIPAFPDNLGTITHVNFNEVQNTIANGITYSIKLEKFPLRATVSETTEGLEMVRPIAVHKIEMLIGDYVKN